MLHGHKYLPVRTLYLHKDQEIDCGFDPLWSLTKKQTSCLQIVGFYPGYAIGYLLLLLKELPVSHRILKKMIMQPNTPLPELMLR